MKIFILSSVLSLIFTAVLAQESAIYITDSDINYYSDTVNTNDAYISERCKLDIYYPKDSDGFATVVWFHGGGLTGGNKEIPDALKSKNLCIIGVNYRLSPQINEPSYIEDAASAVAWAFNNIEKYGGSKNKIFVAGHSAGGYLAMMLGLDKSYLEAHNIDADDIAGLIPFSGQAITHFSIRDRKGIKDTQPIIDKYAPLYHVRQHSSPMLLITGDRELEMLGRYEENAYLYRMMKLTGNINTQLIELQGYGHDMTYPAFPLMVNFIKSIVKDIDEHGN